ncbi:H(+)/Cl(-) exchange transporter 4 [Smittium mucronatum]|uniref:H(+)/Cl(-) exchange transporter 4 n=1 Tax=Smittium mucronatum TaxID=133383 RepID=A0A1R0GXE5_9FUNG|nr:H(+)/Cl(-) exchange transporter 4 [Smittium mucronatum]
MSGLDTESSNLLSVRNNSYSSIFRANSFSRDNSKNRHNILRAKSLHAKASQSITDFWQYQRQTHDNDTGERVWYDSYTTINWLEDSQKEQTRLRILSKKSHFVRFVDTLQDWILIIIIGILCGVVAGFISEWTEVLSELKTGYCRKDWRLQGQACEKDWIEWSSLFNNTYLEFGMYCLVGISLSFLAVQLVLRNPTIVPDFVHSNNPSKNSNSLLYTDTIKNDLESVRMAYYGAGSGIPEVKTILSGFVIHGYLGFKILIVKSMGLIFAVASGLMVGKEGPMVHIASCIGNICTRMFSKYSNNESRKRQAISASAAAGVSVAFGAPIGGVLFSLEEVSYYFSNFTLLYSFFCALVAALVLRAFNPFGTGKIVMFQVLYDNNYKWFEMPFFLLIGVFGGLWGALYVKLNTRMNNLRLRYFKGSTILPTIEVVLVTFVSLAISFPSLSTRMPLSKMVGDLFQSCDPDFTKEKSIFCVGGSRTYNHVFLNLTYALIVRCFLAIISFGLKIPSGLVLPSMSIGAIFGRIIGTGVQYAVDVLDWEFFSSCAKVKGNCITPGVYALVGAGATLTGATRTTISVAVILFELTESLTYTLPVMVAIIMSKWIADMFGHSSIYDKVMDLAGYPLLDVKTNFIFDKLYSGDLISGDSPAISIDQINTVASVTKLVGSIRKEGHFDSGIALVDHSMNLVGSISCEELFSALSRLTEWPYESEISFITKKDDSNKPNSSNSKRKALTPNAPNPSFFLSKVNDFSYLVNQAPLSIRKDSPMELTYQIFTRLGVSYVFIEDKGKFYGMISKKNFIAYLESLDSS